MDARARMRVEIALDALSQLGTGDHQPAQNVYCEPRVRPALYPEVPMGEIVAGPCYVCAIGSLMLSAFRGSTLMRSAVRGAHQYFDQLAEHFDPVQLGLIEAAFEGWPTFKPKTGGDEAHASPLAVAFHDHYHTTSRRLRAILENIVRNGGTFDVEDFREGIPEPLPAMQTATVVQPEPPAAMPPETHRA